MKLEEMILNHPDIIKIMKHNIRRMDIIWSIFYLLIGILLGIGITCWGLI